MARTTGRTSTAAGSSPRQATGPLVSKTRVAPKRIPPRFIHATLRVLLNAALDDRIILANPADKLVNTL
jgi:hypothetical protein